ncbi:MAG: aminotransferase class V-fold PLP-dependent enzyme [Deltaproteobacteria bacterium]|nr:aminotransferase class V-fold PLP-dependent enzyme [Deltaproteobacteria bacterium]MBW2360579.1 aminotransferase class V-fold PLP-dependent enzyme [Deltaproteobacteria bacterium]
MTRPETLVPYSAHPAFAKAAKVLGVELHQIALDDACRARVDEAEKLVNENTVLLVGSAPNYPFGTVDPIPELSQLAHARGISFHTDSCLGGFLLPFYEKLGEPVPPFDFRVPGVTTLSADVHKYGYCTKGASVILHREDAQLKQHQLFFWDRWPGGLYASLAMAGARPAAPIAAAWAVMQYLGEEGWHLDRQKDPDALHLMVSPEHDRIVDLFLGDLREAVAHHGISKGAEARYS